MFKIFIVEWNRPDVWEQCAVSWKQNAKNPDNVQVFYVDNHSPDPDMEVKLSALKEKGMIHEFKVSSEHLSPATARNIFWLKEMPDSNPEDIFVKADGNIEALPGWDEDVLKEFEKMPKMDSMTVGENEKITIDHCHHRAYRVIFARHPVVKEFGGFRCYEPETGVKWGCDDIDWARVSLKTQYWSRPLKCFKHHARPNELKNKIIERFRGSSDLRVRAIRVAMNGYKKGKYYIGEWKCTG